MTRAPVVSAVRRASDALGLGPGDTVLSALSGGPDSVALLDALLTVARSRRFAVEAAHLDHGLRAGSAADAAFCGNLGARLGVRVHVRRTAVSPDHGGIEEAARIARHAFLREVGREVGARVIALGHTRDDQAETVLLRLLRGAGCTGLGGIRVEAGDLWHPLLSVSRAEIEAHLAARGLACCEDPTNRDLGIPRNRVRHELLPYLEAHFNPGLRAVLARSADLLAEDGVVIDDAVTVAVRTVCRVEGAVRVLDRRLLGAQPVAVARGVVRHALAAVGCDRAAAVQVDRILALARRRDGSGHRLTLAAGLEVVCQFDEMRLGPVAVPSSAPPWEVELPVPGRVDLPGGLAVEARTTGAGDPIAVAAGPLTVRTRRPGDRVSLPGRVISLRRYLMERRVPRGDRATLPLVAAGARVLWVAGHAVPAAETAGPLVRLNLVRFA